MDDHPYLKGFLRLVTAIARWIGEHWVISLLSGGAAATWVASVLGIRG